MGEQGGSNLNIEEILQLIAGCVAAGNHAASHELLVDFNDNTLNRLSSTIKNGNKNLSNNLSEITKSLNDEFHHNSNDRRILNDSVEEIRKLSKEEAKKREAEEKKKKGYLNVILHPIDTIAKNFPVITSILKTGFDVSKKFIDIQSDNINSVQKFFNNGVYYTKGLDQLHKDAGILGIKASELRDAYVKNSQFLSRLSSLTGNNTDSFNMLLRAVKTTGMEIGMDFNTSLEIASDIAKNTFEKMDEGSDAFDRLIQTTTKYQKFLQKLSFATGQTAENILKAEKSRQQDIAYQAWNKDKRNLPIANILEVLGASSGIKDAFVSGLKNEEFTKAAVANPEMGRILSQLFDLSQTAAMGYLSQDDIQERAAQIMSSANKDILRQPLNYNRAVLANSPLNNAWRMSVNASTIDWNAFNNPQTPPQILLEYQKLQDSITNFKENFLSKLSVNADNMKSFVNAFQMLTKMFDDLSKDDSIINKALTSIGNGFENFVNNLNKVIFPENSILEKYGVKNINELNEEQLKEYNSEISDDFIDRFKHHVLGMTKNEETGEYGDLSDWILNEVLIPIGNKLLDALGMFKEWIFKEIKNRFGIDVEEIIKEISESDIESQKNEMYNDGAVVSFFKETANNILKLNGNDIQSSLPDEDWIKLSNAIKEKKDNISFEKELLYKFNNNFIGKKITDKVAEYKGVPGIIKDFIIDRSVPDIDKILLDKENYQLEAFIKNNLGELTKGYNQASEMLKNGKNNITSDDIKMIVDTINKNNSYQYKGLDRTLFESLLETLINIKQSVKDHNVNENLKNVSVDGY